MSNGPTEKQQQQHRSSIDDLASIINQIMTKLSFENVGEFSGPSQRTLRVSQEVLGMEKDRMGHSWTRGSCQASGCSCCQPQDLASNEGFRSHETRNEPCWKQAFRNWNGVRNYYIMRMLNVAHLEVPSNCRCNKIQAYLAVCFICRVLIPSLLRKLVLTTISCCLL